MFKSLTGDFHVRSELFFIPYKARSPSFDFRCEVKRCQGVRTLGFWHLFDVGCRYFSAQRKMTEAPTTKSVRFTGSDNRRLYLCIEI